MEIQTATHMKKVMMMAAVVLTVSVSAFAGKPVPAVKVVSKSMDVVYFKVGCEMMGATIEVTDANGNVILTSKVTDKKVIVDFYAEPSGSYTIHVKKDGNDELIGYNKVSVSHAELAAHSFVTVTQM
jgi:hypothetical protein